MTDSLWFNGPQHARHPCLSPSPGACSNSCPLNQWCHPAISSPVVPFSYCLQSFPESESFLSQLFASGGQSIGASSSASVLPMNIQDWFPLGFTGLSPCCPRDSQESPPTSQLKSINSSAFDFLYGSTFACIRDYWKNHSLIIWTFAGKVMLLLFNKLSRFITAFLPRSRHLLISWLQSPSAVGMEPKNIKFNTLQILSRLFAKKWWDWILWSSFFECWVLS